MNKHNELRTYTKFQHWLATNYNDLPTTSGEMTERAIKYLQEIKKQKKQLVIGNSTTSTANSYPQGTTITNL